MTKSQAPQPDEAAARLRRLGKRERAEAAAALAQGLREEALALAAYPDGSAAALMTSRYADLPPDITVAEALRRLGAERRAETIYEVFVTDPERQLLGRVALRTLLQAARDARVATLMTAPKPLAQADAEEEAVAREIEATGALATPVVDRDGRLLGVVTYDDALRCLRAAEAERGERFHALLETPEETPYLHLSLSQELRRRAPWVLGLAVAGLMAGYVVHLYEDALDALVILALYMPMVADTGGNVGTQSSSLVIRAIATGEVGLKSGLSVLWKELRVALCLAALLFAFAFLKVTFMSNNADVPAGLTIEGIALAIAIALSIQVLVSTLLGALLPLLALPLRVDPAVMAGPALTTTVDLTGLMIYFFTTTSLLGIAT